MIGREHRMSTSNKSSAALARDAAIARVGRTRRWVIAATAALTAGSAALVSAVAPGRSLASKTSSQTETATGAGKAASGANASSSAVPQLPPVANPSSLGLQGPSQPPQSVPNPSQTQTQTQPQTQTQSAPGPPQSSAPAPAPSSSSGSSGGGGVVSGGS
jgi:hypothetical protein